MWTTLHLQAQIPDIPIPPSADWVPTLLLTVLWIFVTAALAGAIFRHFRPNPPNPKP
jgi:hypothetical protein